MKVFSLQSQTLLQIPQPVRSILKRALIIFIAWKLVYNLVLYPVRIPDRPLTEITAKSTIYLYQKVLNRKDVFFREDKSDPYFPKVALFIGGDRVIGIADPCNGLELFVLYVGFIFCIPTTLKRQLVFIIIGCAAIFVANSFRCLGLAWLNYNNYSMADFAHHYLFKMVIYAMIFYAWVLYSKKYFANAV